MIQNSIIMANFNPMVIDYITRFVRDNVEITDNNERADIITNYLSEFGFTEVGCGTNRIVLKKEDGIVFKIALDERGIKDNNLEMTLSKTLQPYVTITFENLGVIAASEEVTTMSSSDFEEFEDEIRPILYNIGISYLLNDVGPTTFMNWGIRHGSVKDEPVILDYAYLTPITPEMDFSCKKKNCDGKLVYNEDFTRLVCSECGAIFSIGDVASTDFDVIVDMGFNATGTEYDGDVNGLTPLNTMTGTNYDSDDFDELGFNISTTVD